MSAPSLFTRRQYQAICDSLPDPTFILTVSGRYSAVLGGQDKRYYHDGSSLVGKRIGEVLTAAKTQWFLARIQEALDSQQMLVVEYELSARDVLGLPTEGPQEAIWFEGRVTALADPYDGEPAVLWVASNITASKRLQQLLQYQALSDELTGLPNRRRLMQQLERAYAAFREGVPTCLLCLDVDAFKAINDNLGHPAGDQALRDVAHAVQQLAAPEDVVCRLGGDEFAVLCQGRTVENVEPWAQGLRQSGWNALQPYACVEPAPALSLGLAQFESTDVSIEDIMRRADQALYAAKTQGGNRVCTRAQHTR